MTGFGLILLGAAAFLHAARKLFEAQQTLDDGLAVLDFDTHCDQAIAIANARRRMQVVR